jgi:hypothetical protein
MTQEVFVIRNQHGQYWARAGEWVDGREPQRILKLRHHDEAINQLVELSARDIDLRGDIRTCELNSRGEPRVEPSAMLTPTAAERAAELAAAGEGEGEGERNPKPPGRSDCPRP